MGKDAQKQVVLTDEAKMKFEDRIAAIVSSGFGPEGPSREVDFPNKVALRQRPDTQSRMAD